MNKTAIVILNWNGLQWLKMFLGSVVKHSTGNNTIVCVADNSSTDGSQEWLEKNFRDIILIKLDKNYGFAGGYNMAISQLQARYFVLLNSDIEVTEGWLTPLVNYMENNPGVASCQPKILSYYRKDFFEHAGASGGFIDKYGYPFCRGRILHNTEKDTGQYNNPVNIAWSTGACMIVRNDAWEKCLGFDTDFFAHMEEIDLCWRFSKAGYKMACIPESVVYHVGGASLPYESPFKTYLNFRNSLFLLYKNLPDDKLHKILFIRKILDGLAALMFLCKGKPGHVKAIWRAHLDYYKSLKDLKAKRKIVKELEIDEAPVKLLNKSIIFEFYIRGNKTFHSLQVNKES